MKRRILPFALLLIANISFAQHTLLRSEMLGFGSTFTTKNISDFSVIDTTIQGNNATWDFSTLTNDASTDDVVLTIMDPKKTPHTSSFPNATFTYIETVGTTNYYRYFNITADKLERVGSYTSFLKTYSDPQIEYVFPLTLGTKNMDTWANTSSSTGGTYGLECVGSGILKTPSGTFDALMVRVHTVEFFDMYAYFWYSADNGCQLLSYIVGDGFFMSTTGSYATDIKPASTTNVNEIEFNKNITYNNVIENTLNVSFKTDENTNCSYSVLNSMGELVFQESSFINDKNLTINFSDYASGIYFVKLTTKDNIVTTLKIIKK